MTEADIEATAVLVHLSDLHFTIDNPGLEARNGLLRDRLRADLGKLVDEIGRPADAVLVTGDIAYGGKRAEYEQADDWFKAMIDPITNGSTRLLCVPGNHDLDWDRIGPTHRAHREHIKGVDEDDLDALLDGYLAEDGQAILHPLEAYNEFAASLDCQVEARFSWDTSLSLEGGYELDFRGVTTVVNSHDDDGPGTLAVHSNQLLHTPVPGRIPVLLAHHDPYFWRRHHHLAQAVSNRMSIAMYGHTHEPRLRQVDQCVEITGGAVQPEEGGDWTPAYNVVQLSVSLFDTTSARMSVKVWRRRFSSQHDSFISDCGSGMYDVREVVISAPISEPQPAQEPPDPQHDPAGDRVALTEPDGSPSLIREIQRALYSLGAGDRITLVASLGLPVDDLVRLPAHRFIPEAAAAIIATGKLDAFREALTQRAERQGDTCE